MEKEPQEKKMDSITKKIIKIYQNYGLDISDMSVEEFDRMKEMYQQKKSDIDADLKQSEKFINDFSEDIL